MPGSRDWPGLPEGPAGLIVDRVLSYDVADYIRFRAVCRPWRQCSADPRAHGVMDRRFHPWRWTMLLEDPGPSRRRSFLNTSTGECIQVDIPELRHHQLVAVSAEGLLVLLRKPRYTQVRLLNPLTGHLLTDLPPITPLLPPGLGSLRYLFDVYNGKGTAWGSGIADDGSTVVLSFNRQSMVATAKPGDDHWTPVSYYDGCSMGTAPLMLAGRFYCVTLKGVMVLKIHEHEPPRLELAANLNMRVRPFQDCMHLVNNSGELLLVHRQRETSEGSNNIWNWKAMYDTYRVDLDTGALFQVNSLGSSGAGRAVFMGMDTSLSVSLDVFPPGSITADTIYLSFDFGEAEYSNIGAYHLTFGCMGRASRLCGGLVPRPHTLVDCLSFSNTVKYTV